ncbi:MAG: hypothetical protein JSV90_05325 [Methanobacteriota archaeon]|nr:MAG: hypothetical protein JSV90_05325 [Euryarchaeota archaeon]
MLILTLVGIDDIRTVTSKDRILLYLSDFTHLADRYELPCEVTQESIATATGVQRKHLSQYLKDLTSSGCLIQRKAHVKGMRQRMNGYYLSPVGYAKATELKEALAEVVVPVNTNKGVQDMRLDEIDEATSVHITFCDIVTEAVTSGRLDMASLESIETRRLRAISATDAATEAYRRALATAWRDGKVTATERFLIEELRSTLKVSEEQHRTLEAEILKKLAEDHMEFRRIYRSVLEIALSDGVVEGPEADILESLRRMLRISQDEHDEIHRDLEYEIFGPGGRESAEFVSDN